VSDIDVKGRTQRVPKERRPRDPEGWSRRPIEKSRRKGGLAFRPDPAFFALADRVVRTKRTLLGYDRLYVFWQAVRNLVDVPGAVAEIGSYRGGSAFFIATAFRERLGEEVPMHVFDTFEGHPPDAITAHDAFHTTGHFSATNVKKVTALLSEFQQLQIHKGDVSAALPQLAESTYRLLHIDTDLYQPTRVCLEYFTPRLSPRGVIVLDDYGSGKCPGVAKAAVEFLQQHDAFDVWDIRTEQLVLVKRC